MNIKVKGCTTCPFVFRKPRRFKFGASLGWTTVCGLDENKRRPLVVSSVGPACGCPLKEKGDVIVKLS